MAENKAGKGARKRSGYHHGNLREALIEAALDLIEEKGASGFTFAEAARAAGVTPAAPYRHYKDREDLIADIARVGFDNFAAALSQAALRAEASPFDGVREVGIAYLTFARSEPAFYTAMFEAGIPHDRNKDLSEASTNAFAVMRNATEKLIASLPAAQRPPVGMMHFHIWSLVHGIADLFARGDGTRRKLPMQPEDLLEAGLLVYLRGLGFRES